MSIVALLFGALLGLALTAASAATAWWAGANGGGMVYVVAGNAFTVLFLWGLLVLLRLLAVPERQPFYRTALRAAVVVTVLGFLTWPSAHAAGVVRATERVATASAELVAAIEAFESEHGLPPGRLIHLLPDYLEVLPSTGLGIGALHTYERCDTVASSGVRMWWDVGAAGPSARDGVLDPTTGPEDRATFTALVGSAGRVESTRTYRIGRMTDPAPFDRQQWDQAGEHRRGQALALTDGHPWRGATREAMVQHLGPPDGEAPAPETTFALRAGMDLGTESPGQHVYLDAACEPTWQRWAGTPPLRTWFYLAP